MGKKSQNKKATPRSAAKQPKTSGETQAPSPQLQRSLIVDGMHNGFSAMVNETLGSVNAICSGNQFLMYHVLEECTARIEQLRRVGLTQSIANETAAAQNRAGA